MTDHVSPDVRSLIMGRVQQKNSGPELRVRRMLHARGYRFRLHKRELPGTPDISFPKYKKVVFVHGCFWHGHNCQWGKLPKTRMEYWQNKIETNRERDSRNVTALADSGWVSLVIWQCELRDAEQALLKMCDFLGSDLLLGGQGVSALRTPRTRDD
ncbi:MAG: very short patch repair endonuclease [Cucumibacter sp.]